PRRRRRLSPSSRVCRADGEGGARGAAGEYHVLLPSARRADALRPGPRRYRTHRPAPEPPRPARKTLVRRDTGKARGVRHDRALDRATGRVAGPRPCGPPEPATPLGGDRFLATGMHLEPSRQATRLEDRSDVALEAAEP